MINYIIFDFETGGLDFKKNPAMEIALMSIKGDSLLEISRYESLISNYIEEPVYTNRALDIHGISVTEANTKGKKIEDLVIDLIEEFEKAKGSGRYDKPVLVGHNTPFDIAYLQDIFSRCKKDLSKYIQTNKDIYNNKYPGYQDTLLLAKSKWGNDPTMIKYKLEFCLEKAGIESIDTHRAMSDVILEKELFVYFLTALRQDGGESNFKREKFRETFQF